MPARRSILLQLVCTLALVATCSQAAGSEAAASEDAAAALRRETRSDHYGVYLGGAKVGWAERSSGPIMRFGRARLRIGYRVHLRFKTDGELRETRIEREKIFLPTAPYRLVAGLSEIRRGRRGKRVKLRTASGRLVADVTSAGSTRTLAVAARPTTFDEELRPHAVARTGLAGKTTVAYRRFDLSALETKDASITLVPEDALVEGVSTVGSDRDLVRYDRDGRLVWSRTVGLLEMRRQPAAEAMRLPTAVDALAHRFAAVDRPLGPPHRVDALVLRVRGRGVARIRSGPRQEARYDAATRTLTLRLGRAARASVRATPAEIHAALAETAAYPIRHTMVRTLGEEVAATGTTPREKVAKLLAFVQGFVLDTRDTATLTTLEVLARQEGDCSEHALLFTSLARAAGIPTREVVGVVYRGDGDRRFGWHQWAEVVLDGRWVPVDPMHGQLPVDATHIREGLVGTASAAGFALAGATLEVVSIEARPEPREGYSILDDE